MNIKKKMVKATEAGLKIVVGVGGQESLFMISDRLQECIQYLYDNDLRHITITTYQGYIATDILFLEGLKDFLEGLVILDPHHDYTVIKTLHKLKTLGLPDNDTDIVNLEDFPLLESCALRFSKRLIGLDSCTNLKNLALTSYNCNAGDLSCLPNLQSLEYLSLINPQLSSLVGIEKFRNLKTLDIYSARKLEDVSALHTLTGKLETVIFQNCKKVKNFETLGNVTSLKKIMLGESGSVQSLAFVKMLPELKFISFWETIVLDGNLSYCEGVDYVGFNNKKHYSHKDKQFKKIT